jgi:N-acetylneuraminic acid mutarotase
MTHRHLLNTATIAVLSALLACTDDSPTQPENNRDPGTASPQFAWASNSWMSRASLPSTRNGLEGGVANNSSGASILYVFGGLRDGASTIDPSLDDYVTTIQAYDYASNSWTTKASSFQGYWMSGVGLIDGKLYIPGGFAQTPAGHRAQRTLHVYDPALDVMTTRAPLPRPVVGGVSGVIDGRLYVFTGGCVPCEGFVSRRFYRYDPATNTWTFLNWSPHGHLFGAGGVINGKFYIAGGINETRDNSDDLDVYDPVSGRWTTRAPMPDIVANVGGGVLNNKLYLVGGEVGPDKEANKRVFVYDPASNTWSEVAPTLSWHFNPVVVRVTAFGNSKLLSTGHKTNEAYKP